MDSQPVIADTNRDLAEAVLQSGDDRAFRELYRRHTPRLLALLVRLLGDRADAEDAVQETWIRVCQSLGRFRWESAFSSWLTGIGINAARDTLRRRGRSLVVSTDEPPDIQVRPEDSDGRLDLERCIARLPDGYRQVLVLHDVEGMTHRDIAEHLGISDGTSKSQLTAARRRIRSLLNPKTENDHA